MNALDFSSSAGQIYKRMLRHIRIHGLREGSVLPAQPLWQKELGCGTVSFNAAMKMLESQGVVERRKKAGTTLLRTAPEQVVPWTIGLCFSGVSLPLGGVMHAVLSQFLHVRLQAAGCQVRVYHNQKGHRLNHYLEEFDSLVEDVQGENLDGLLVGMQLATVEHQRLAQSGVATCSTHSTTRPADELHGAQVTIDEGPMIQQATRLLGKLGCRRIALVLVGAPWMPHEKHHAQVFEQAIASGPASGMVVKGWNSVGGGQEIARRLLDMPAQDRPDGLICTQNDHVTLGITHQLVGHSSYRPQLASFANLQVPLPFLLPVHRFELDVAQVAQKNVQMLLQQLHCPGQRSSGVGVIPTLHEAKATLVPSILFDEEGVSPTFKKGREPTRTGKRSSLSGKK